MSTLFIGIGGGMDIFGCVPLLSESQNSYLINLSFTDKKRLEAACRKGIAQRRHPWVYEIFPCPSRITQYLEEGEYFPELRLATYLNRNVLVLVPYDKDTVSDKDDPTISEFSDYFHVFVVEKDVHWIYYVDGGSDSLMKGDELGLGTPTEDMFTLRIFENVMAKLSNRKRIHRYLALVGLDVDTAHGIKLEDLNTRVDELVPREVRTLTEKDPAVQAYVQTVLACHPEHSIVHSLVIGAIRGLRGFHVPPWLRPRLKKNLVNLTDRLAKMFVYSIQDVLQENIYWADIDNAFTCEKLDRYITDRHERAYFDNIMTPLLNRNATKLCWEYLGCVLF